MRTFAFRRLQCACAVLLLSAPATAAEFKSESAGTTTIPAAMHRVYVLDAALPHIVDGRIYVLDAADLSLKGMLEAGFAGMMLAAPDRRRIYVATTFYERLTRGKRIDVVQVFDDQTLKVIDEIPIPTRRAQALSYRSLFQRSSDGNVLFIQNATPATSISVVDTASKRQLETPAPGCYGIYPAPTKPLRFSTLCGDGTIGTYTMSSNFQSSERKTSAKLFDTGADPLFIHAERDQDGYVFLSFKGKLLRASLDGESATITETLDIIPPDAADWAPGGYQPFAVDPKSGMAYILMHPGNKDGDHKNPSAEIWAYDLRGKRLVARSRAANLTSLTLSAVDPALLFGINPVDLTIERFTIDASSHQISRAGQIRLGETAALVEAPR
ncbi:hypothetical protein I6F35_14035 [Bradyrhizobium sp. BRP22]|uniref:amine dehydrogenase large subunit n=1 Tax=Bradyrhizobium sp. BRP22 TaxID=2793821 RepID=UPI001CD362B6|nr:amine dehydrogenase large subunit [Bradyrhizobium sp. BRP22]MCA1454328.1 hypothetical protein [Bradyrhizobium sp. BRP22]